MITARMCFIMTVAKALSVTIAWESSICRMTKSGSPGGITYKRWRNAQAVTKFNFEKRGSFSHCLWDKNSINQLSFVQI